MHALSKLRHGDPAALRCVGFQFLQQRSNPCPHAAKYLPHHWTTREVPQCYLRRHTACWPRLSVRKKWFKNSECGAPWAASFLLPAKSKGEVNWEWGWGSQQVCKQGILWCQGSPLWWTDNLGSASVPQAKAAPPDGCTLVSKFYKWPHVLIFLPEGESQSRGKPECKCMPSPTKPIISCVLTVSNCREF